MNFIKGEILTADKMNQIQPDTLTRIRGGHGILIQRDYTGITISQDRRYGGGLGMGDGGVEITTCSTGVSPITFGDVIIGCTFYDEDETIPVLLPHTLWPVNGPIISPGRATVTVTPAGYHQRVVWMGVDRYETQQVTPAYHLNEILVVGKIEWDRELMLSYGIPPGENKLEDERWTIWTDLNFAGRTWAKIPDKED